MRLAALHRPLVTLVVAVTTVAVATIAVTPGGDGADEGSNPVPLGRDAATDAQEADARMVVAVPELPSTGMLDVDEQILFWQHRVETNDRDYLSRTQLASALLRRARANHDLGDAQAAEDQLDRALEANPTYGTARALLAATRAMFHEFASAREIALDAYADDPADLVALATAGDAAFELGSYEEAARLYERLEAELGGAEPAVAARMARLLAVRGATAAAIGRAEAAVEASADGPLDERAYYLLLLGELHRGSGGLDAAAAAFTRALELSPRYGPAIESLATVRAAQGRLDQAEVLWRRSGDVIGKPDFHVLAALGNIEQARGRHASARRYWVEALAAVDALPPRERVGFWRDESRLRADHDLDPEEALRLARADLQLRSDAHAWDTLGWALAANGRYEEAAEAMERALATGGPDTLVAYHAAVVYERLGMSERAHELLGPALAINPRFDLVHADAAAALLRRLG